MPNYVTLERRQGQRPQQCPLLREGFVDDTARGRVNPRIYYRVRPVTQLRVHIIEVAEGGGKEEVVADAAGRPAR